jgi:hypothetical protein
MYQIIDFNQYQTVEEWIEAAEQERMDSYMQMDDQQSAEWGLNRDQDIYPITVDAFMECH